MCDVWMVLRMNLGSMFLCMIKGKVSEVLLLHYITFTFKLVEKAHSYTTANNIFFQSERKLWVRKSWWMKTLPEIFLFLQLLWPIYFYITQKKLGFLLFMVIVNIEIWKNILLYSFRSCYIYKYINNPEWNIFYIIAFESRSILPCFYIKFKRKGLTSISQISIQLYDVHLRKYFFMKNWFVIS